MRRGIAVLLLVVASCSQGGERQGSPTTPTTTTSPGVPAGGSTLDLTGDGSTVSVSIEQQDSFFAPASIEVVPGASVEAHVQNRGSIAHTFTIDEMPVDLELAPGASKVVSFELPGEGSRVTFSCRFHAGAGMRGAFVFGEAESPQEGEDDFVPGY